MMTQQDVAQQYQVDMGGRIASLGKFEGEHWSTVALYNVAIDGGADESLQWGEDECEDIFILDDEMRAAIGCDATEYAVTLYHDSQGFVYGQTVDRDTYDQRVNENEMQIEAAWEDAD